MTYKVYEVPSSEPILTLFFGIFFWWISNEILSRLFGFKGNIYQTKVLKEYDQNMEQNTDTTKDNDVSNANGDGNSPDTGSITIEMERLGSNSGVNSTPLSNNGSCIKPTLKLHQRMSKSLDVNNEYRIKINPIQFIIVTKA